MNHRKYLSTLFNGYRSQGHGVFTVTLSTFVKSEAFARSPKMTDFCSSVFIRRIQKHLSIKDQSKLDFEFIIEQSPDGYFHFHGFLAAPKSVADRIYPGGQLNRHIARDLACLSRAGKYRTFKVNKFEIEPATNINQWASYITKTNNYIN